MDLRSLKRELAARPPRARSLIVTIWGDALAPHGGEVWLSTLMRLVSPFGCNERLTRTSVFRLARDGWLAGVPIGRRTRYRLTADGARRFADAYRRVYTPPLLPWDGRWEIVVEHAPLAAGLRRSLREELAWHGFGPLSPTVHGRPARSGSEIATMLAAIGCARQVSAFIGADDAALPGSGLADRVEHAFALGALAAEYRRFNARFAGVVDAFRRARRDDAAQAFFVRTMLVHEYRRVRLRDPQLPAALLPRQWPGLAAYALCRDFYRAAAPLAEAHLAGAMAADGDAIPEVLPGFDDRFRAFA